MSNSLICITTCRRLDLVKKYLLPYVSFTRNNKNFSFILAEDGSDPGYFQFTNQYQIPHLRSDIQEGVGLSKNRVFKMFPDFDYYFFLDDDVELFDESVFLDYVTFLEEKKFDHMSSTRFFELKEQREINGKKLNFGLRGGGYFNFFTREGLEKVGGWHTDFAQWKRYGHTEHSYRFVNAGLQEYPFVVLEDSINKVIIHSPEHVSEPLNHLVDPENELFEHEKYLIDQKLSYFPLATISPFYFNGKSLTNPGNELITQALESGDRYFLLTDRKARRQAKAEYKVFELNQKSSFFYKVKLLTEIVFLAPTNNAFKHWIKLKLKRNPR